MKFVSDFGTEMHLNSPQEVIAFRNNRGSGKNFNFNEVLTPNIADNLTKIHKIHGYKYEEPCLGLLRMADNELLFGYDFKSGYRITFGPYDFPKDIQKNVDFVHLTIEYTLMILEAFGWVVTFSEDKSWYYLNFAPLLALTPEEVNAEIEQRVNILAAKALRVINEGLVKHQTRFYRKELGLALAMVLSEDLDLVINRLKLLLGPKWLLTNWNYYRLDIIPTTTPS